MHEDLLKEQHLEAMRKLKEETRLKHDEAIRQANEEGRLMDSQYVRQLAKEAMRQWGDIQPPGLGNTRYPVGAERETGIPRSASLANMQDPQRPLEPGEWRDCTPPADPVDLSPLHGPNYRNLPAFLAGRDRVIIAEICEHLGLRYSRAEAVRIGRELRARAWRPALWRVDGKIVSGFHRPGFQKPRKVVKPAPPPTVGFWRRLLNLLVGGDR